MFYAAHNSNADLRSGNRGFANTWEVSRFSSRSDRDAFVEEFENQLARPVTRAEAVALWRSQFETVGKPIPKGGLFKANRFGSSEFYNEYAL